MPKTADQHRDPRCELLDVLLCPLCHDRLEPSGRTLRCTHQHAFDIARHGYVNLLTGKKRTVSADTAAMVEARVSFLQAGHYAPLARALSELTVQRCGPGSKVLDAGAGTGYCLAAVLDRLTQALSASDWTFPHTPSDGRREPIATPVRWRRTSGGHCPPGPDPSTSYSMSSLPATARNSVAFCGLTEHST